MDFSLYDAA